MVAGLVAQRSTNPLVPAGRNGAKLAGAAALPGLHRRCFCSSLTRGASLLEPACLPIQLIEVGAELLARLLPLPGQPGPIPDVPGAQDRSQHLISVDPQIIDAGHGDLHRAASEA